MVLTADVWNQPFSTTSLPMRDVDLPARSNTPRLYDSSAVRPVQSLAVLMLPKGVQIPGSDFELRRPLVAEAEATWDGYVFRSGCFDEESFGSTIEESLLDFLTSLVDRYHSLARRERLSEPDQLVLSRLRSLLEP